MEQLPERGDPVEFQDGDQWIEGWVLKVHDSVVVILQHELIPRRGPLQHAREVPLQADVRPWPGGRRMRFVNLTDRRKA